MRGLTTLNEYVEDMFRDINRVAVGFEPTFRMLDQVRSSASTSYPPYDLEKIEDNHYRLSMAVAGFTPEDLDITLQDGVLTIEGKTVKDENRNYLYKGIAGRNFRRTFYLNAYVQVKSSNLANGILTLDFVHELPEAMKPRKISIGSSQATTMIEGNKS